MFPILVTVQNEAQLAAVQAALSGAKPAAPAGAAAKVSPTKAAAAPKTSAPAAVVAKAEKAAEAPLPKVDRKALGTLVTQIADDFIVGEENVGRPRIVALIQEFGAAKLSGIPDAVLHQFETKARALHAELSAAAGGEAATTESLV